MMNKKKGSTDHESLLDGWLCRLTAEGMTGMKDRLNMF